MTFYFMLYIPIITLVTLIIVFICLNIYISKLNKNYKLNRISKIKTNALSTVHCLVSLSILKNTINVKTAAYIAGIFTQVGYDYGETMKISGYSFEEIERLTNLAKEEVNLEKDS